MLPDKSNSLRSWLLAAAILLVLVLTLVGYARDRNISGNLEELRAELSQAREENREVRNDLSLIREDFRNVRSAAEALESLLASSSEELSDSIRAGLRRNEQLIAEKEDALEEIQTELKNFREKMSFLEQESRDLIAVMSNETSQFKEFQEQNSESLKELAASLENLRTLHANLKCDLEEVKGNLLPSEEMKKILENHHVQIVEIRDDLRKKSASLNREMTRIEGDLKELRLEINRIASINRGD